MAGVSTHSPALAGAAEVVALVRRQADAQGRDDLVAALDRIRSGLTVAPVRVVFVGEPAQGKTSVVNALVGAPVLPVGATTAVPVEVHLGETYEAALWTDSVDSASGATRRAVSFADAHGLASEVVNPGNRWRLHAIELAVPSSTLHRGLCLVDTPPLSRLWNAAALRTVAAFGSAAAVVLVTSASAELTATELDVLRVAHGLCQQIVVAVNGTTTYRQWPSVVERDQLLLERAGISATVIPLDAAPYWGPAGGRPPGPDPGMAMLLAHLGEQVVLDHEQARISRALTETFWAADRLRMRLVAERALIGDDAALDATLARLRAAAGHAHDLCGADAGWSRALDDGMRRLRADLAADLRSEIEQLRLDAGDDLAAGVGDPAAFTVHLHTRIARAAVRFQRVRKLSLRALCDRVAQQFRDDCSAVVAALAVSPEAHALLHPRLDRPDLDGRGTVTTLPVGVSESLPPIDLRDLASGWVHAAQRFLEADTERILTDVAHDIDLRCRDRATELHRSLVEVLTSLTVLRGVDPAAIARREAVLSTDLAVLTAFPWAAGDPDAVVDLRHGPDTP